jgi:hypothetical protein
MNMGETIPPCPACHASSTHVEIVVIILPRRGPERTDFHCRACDHPFTVLTPQKDEDLS